MDAQRIEDVTEWESRRFSNGFADLRRLADRGFSGAVTDGTGWLLLLNGRVVGVVDAELDSFADASGTAYQAPDDCLPLLFAMQEAGGTKRAQYYTNDTSLAEADRKLSTGGFTGYIELSENVLSGDYYVTYTGGESRPVAFVGNARRLETGEEAFELADDEVGIYSVYEVDLDVREVPDPAGRDAGAATRDEAAGTAKDPGGSTVEADAVAAAERVGDSEPEPATVEEAEPPGPGRTAESAEAAEAADSTEAAESAESVESAESAESAGAVESAESAESTESVEGESEHDPDGPVEATGQARSVEDPPAEPPSDGGPSVTDTTSGDTDVFSREEQWRETTAIPALDPKETSSRPESNADPRRRTRQGRAGHARGRPVESDHGDRSGRTSSARSPEPRAGSGGGRSAVSRRPTDGRSADASGSTGGSTNARSTAERSAERDSRIAELESTLETLEQERDSLTAERDEIAADRDEQKAKRERLESEVESLKKARDRLQEELSAVRAELPDGEQTVPAAQARSETNLFIRYGSKGDATLEDAHDGDVDRDALRGNLRIEHHTGFESEGAVVDGVPYREFLEGTMEYGFTRWLVEDLPFEIRDTGNESDLRDLYDALPEIDRAEIDGSVSIVSREGGEETREQRTFDLVLRDRMGNPLFIADLNDSRAPTGGATLESLVANGGSVAGSNDAFAAAFAVTASYFEPEALETASDAVGGGLFGTKRRSFVKLSRKRGYHLCLAESRDGGFHLTVPDL